MVKLIIIWTFGIYTSSTELVLPDYDVCLQLKAEAEVSTNVTYADCRRKS